MIYGTCNTYSYSDYHSDFSEALKEGGKALGQGVSQQVSQLFSAIRQKFRAVGTEGLLTRVQNQPTEHNKSIFQAELETQMSEDKPFANHLSELIKQLESAGVIRQLMARDIEAKGILELDEAIIEYRKAIAINSNDEEVRLDLARALLRKSQWELAITECREATSLNPNNATAHVLWGYALVQELLQGEIQQDKIEEASKHFKKARDLFRAQGNTQEADKLDEYLAR